MLSVAFGANDSGQITAAGNSPDGESIHTFRLDPIKAPPVTTATPSPAPNAGGWNNTNVTVALHATDGDGFGVKQIQYSLSGAQTLPAQTVNGPDASVTISAEGTTTLTYFATGNSGQVEQAKALVVKIDKTPPAITGMPAASCSIWPPNGVLVKVATVTASDATSGISAGSFTVSGASSEPPDATDPDVVIAPTAAGGFDVNLRAERLDGGPGRTYTVTAAAADLAGNQASSTATCKVPHDLGN